MQLSLAEVLSLHFGRSLFNFRDGTSFAEDLTGAIERLEPAISRADQHLVRQLDTKFVAVPEPSKRWTERSSEVIDEAIDATGSGGSRSISAKTQRSWFSVLRKAKTSR